MNSKRHHISTDDPVGAVAAPPPDPADRRVPPADSERVSTPSGDRPSKGSGWTGGLGWFPIVVLSLCLVGLIVAGVMLMQGKPAPSQAASDQPVFNSERSGGIAFGSQPANPNANPTDLVVATAAAMGDVTSVEFDVTRTGASVFIDQFESIALDQLLGQFEAPADAQATIDVTIDGTNRTTLGAVAYGSDLWVSNPITGVFETLPDGYDIDPSRFFDPKNGWQPLVRNLTDVSLVGIENRDGVEAYHLAGTAAAADVANITVGLVRDQDVPVDLWIDPGTSLVMYADFVTTAAGGGTSEWALALRDYGADFTISPPPRAETGQTG